MSAEKSLLKAAGIQAGAAKLDECVNNAEREVFKSAGRTEVFKKALTLIETAQREFQAIVLENEVIPTDKVRDLLLRVYQSLESAHKNSAVQESEWRGRIQGLREASNILLVQYTAEMQNAARIKEQEKQEEVASEDSATTAKPRSKQRAVGVRPPASLKAQRLAEEGVLEDANTK